MSTKVKTNKVLLKFTCVFTNIKRMLFKCLFDKVDKICVIVIVIKMYNK